MTDETASNGADRRRDILRAAAELFETVGYDATRVADIAAKAGVAKGLVFWYFESKEELLHQLAATVEDGLLRLIQTAVEGVERPLDRLYVATLVAAHYIDDNYYLYGAINVASRGREDSPYRAAFGVHIAYASAAVRRWQRSGEVRHDDSPEHLAYSLAAIVNELVRLRRNGVINRSAGQMAAMAARFAVYGVAARTADAQAAVAAHGRLARRGRVARSRAPAPLRAI